MTKVVLEPSPDFLAADDEYVESRQTIVDYIVETAHNRAKVVTEGDITSILTVLSSEMALAGALGQIDTVAKLANMANRLAHAEATWVIEEQSDYQRRFGDAVREDLDSVLRD
tara:strand:+ start:113 stop:451 length:339 start_codon:yes stop_codon:yes gene_type:complete